MSRWPLIACALLLGCHSTVALTGPDCAAPQVRCGDACSTIASDPLNCGACGVRCAEGDVCAGGGCAGQCRPGTVECSQRCVDPGLDNANCGGCGVACPAGTGCAGGTCVPVLTLGTPASCPDNGPAISLPDGKSYCSADLARSSFRFALCSCADILSGGTLTTDAAPTSVPGGNVGLAGIWLLAGSTAIDGSLWNGSTKTFTASRELTVGRELRTAGQLRGDARVTIGGDAFAGGNVDGSGPIVISGALHVPTSANVAPSATFRERINEPVSVPAPCGCGAEQRFSISQLLDEAQAKNDDAAIGLAVTALASNSEAKRVDLPCGRFYLDSINATAPLAIVARGRTALFVRGDVVADADLRISVEPPGQLDLFVGGAIDGSAPLQLGNANQPSLMRVYVGGTGGVTIPAGSRLSAFVHASAGPIRSGSALEVYGGLVAGVFGTTSNTSVHFDPSILEIGAECGPGPGSTCSSCRDCGNQACVGGVCGACTESTQCCAPLTCNAGRCVLP